MEKKEKDLETHYILNWVDAKLKGIGKFFNNKKSAIAATLNCVMIWVISKDLLDQDTALMIASGLSAWTGLAVGHKIVKGTKKSNA